MALVGSKNLNLQKMRGVVGCRLWVVLEAPQINPETVTICTKDIDARDIRENAQ